jgi:hypothetical protein
MRPVKTLIVSVACGALLIAAPAANAKKTKPKLKVFTTKTISRTVTAPQRSGEFFEEKALVDAKCGKGYMPLALGISSATNPLAGQDLGFVGMSVYASGAEGRAKTKLQALCVRGGRSPYYIGKEVKLGANGMGTLVKASLSCPSGSVALGAALAHGHAPAFGAYTSMPNGKRRWDYSAQLPSSVISQLSGNVGALGYPRAACVRAKGVSTKDFRGSVTATPARGKVTCKRGRVLGWGVDLGAESSRAGSNGSWAIPTIERAKFSSSRSMSFSFKRSVDGAGSTAATAVKATVICGTLTKG